MPSRRHRLFSRIVRRPGTNYPCNYNSNIHTIRAKARRDNLQGSEKERAQDQGLAPHSRIEFIIVPIPPSLSVNAITSSEEPHRNAKSITPSLSHLKPTKRSLSSRSSTTLRYTRRLSRDLSLVHGPLRSVRLRRTGAVSELLPNH